MPTFRIELVEYCDGRTIEPNPDKPPVPGAVLVTEWVEQRRQREWRMTKTPKCPTGRLISNPLMT